jgi:hypothetical protein
MTCVDVERPEPSTKGLQGRYGVYRLNDHAWWWRVELTVPEELPVMPTPPEPGPVVFVLDASRSILGRGGLPAQLAIVDAYIRDAPAAEVELILTSRTTQAVFGRLRPAADVPEALTRLATTRLGNGSSLDKGAALAADVLAGSHKPGRIVLMTDGQLRSRFNQSAVLEALRRAPSGTVVHLLYPEASTDAFVGHRVPQGLDALPAAMGGAAYDVVVDPANSTSLRPLLKRLLSPDRLESLELVDPRVARHWPDSPEDPNIFALRGATEVLAGEVTVWGGLSRHEPPPSLSMTGWVWGKKQVLALPLNPALERTLPHLVSSEAGPYLECAGSRPHLARARSEGFLSHALALWVSGSGDTEHADVPRGPSTDCMFDNMGTTLQPEGPAPPEPMPEITAALAPCGLARAPHGPFRVRLEVQHGEVLDVSVDGGGTEARRCAEDALWGLSLSAALSDHPTRRAEYSFALALRPGTVSAP